MLAVLPQVDELKRLLPKYISERHKGMDAGHLADELGIPLKDVISYLIEEKELSDENIDLELFRVMVRKQKDIDLFLQKFFDISKEELDKMLLNPHNSISREVWENKQQRMLIPFVGSFGLFLLASQMPIQMILNVLGLLFTVLMAKLISEKRPESSRELVLGAFRSF
jgi:hypothetical protein